MRVAAVLLAALVAGGCQGIDKDRVRDTAHAVLERHDGYVRAGDDSPASALAESAAARALLEGEGRVAGPELGRPLRPCLERHDAYVGQDGELSAVEARVALRSSEILRKILDQTGG